MAICITFCFVTDAVGSWRMRRAWKALPSTCALFIRYLPPFFLCGCSAAVIRVVIECVLTLRSFYNTICLVLIDVLLGVIAAWYVLHHLAAIH